MTATITLPIPDRKLSPNTTVGSRGGRMAKAAAIKKYRTLAKVLFWSAYAASFRPKWKKARCVIKWFTKRAVFPDGDNALASMKPAFDGLADAGLFDNDRGVAYEPVEFAKDAANPRVELHITRIL